MRIPAATSAPSVDETLKAGGFAIEREARIALIASLGGDRLATRGESSKLMLYAHGQREITLADVDAIMSDVSSLAMDAVVDAAFAGEGTGLETGSRRLAAEGVARFVHARRGAAPCADAADRAPFRRGRTPIPAVMETMRSLHFRRKSLVERHLQRWTSDEPQERHHPPAVEPAANPPPSDLDDTIAAKTLLDIARSGAAVDVTSSLTLREMTTSS